jgi:hypothetical protein
VPNTDYLLAATLYKIAENEKVIEEGEEEVETEDNSFI